MLMVQGQLTPVTLSANESTPKPRICRDMLPLQASQQPVLLQAFAAYTV